MGYQYIFDAEACWYKGVCNLYKTEDCNPACPRFMEMDYLMKHSGIPKNRQYPTYLVPDPRDREAFLDLKDIKDDIVNFVEQGENLYLYSSNFGNGKTTWAIKLLQAYFNRIWPGNGFRIRGLFIHAPSFLTKTKQIIRTPDDDFEALKNILPFVDLVIWDDIASTKLGDYDHANLLTYIDQRVLSGLSNIYTGNLGQEDLVDALGNRLTSRVWNGSTNIKLVGNDRRGAKI